MLFVGRDEEENVITFAVQICRFVDRSFPGFVECEFRDASGRVWRFIEKVPVVSRENLDESSDYPRTGTVACDVSGPTAVDGVVRVTTERPWGIETVDGVAEFDMQSSTLVET